MGQMAHLCHSLKRVKQWEISAVARVKLHLAQKIAEKEHIMLYLPEELVECPALKPDIKLQANAEMNTEEAWIRRERLKADPAIQAALREWWEALSVKDSIDKNHYLAACEEAMLLIDPNASPEELLEVAIEDWNIDTQEDHFADPAHRHLSPTEVHKKVDHLDYDKFCGSMFELADIWCPTIDGEEYANFLKHLYTEIVESGKLTGRLGNLRAMTHWRLLRHVMESPVVLHKHGGYDSYDNESELDRAARDMALEILHMCLTAPPPAAPTPSHCARHSVRRVQCAAHLEGSPPL